jgi:hypothetical protein
VVFPRAGTQSPADAPTGLASRDAGVTGLAVRSLEAIRVLGTEGVADAPVGSISLTVDTVGVDLQQDRDAAACRRS